MNLIENDFFLLTFVKSIKDFISEKAQFHRWASQFIVSPTEKIVKWWRFVVRQFLFLQYLLSRIDAMYKQIYLTVIGVIQLIFWNCTDMKDCWPDKVFSLFDVSLGSDLICTSAQLPRNTRPGFKHTAPLISLLNCARSDVNMIMFGIDLIWLCSYHAS